MEAARPARCSPWRISACAGIPRFHHPRTGRNGDRGPGARDPDEPAKHKHESPHRNPALLLRARPTGGRGDPPHLEKGEIVISDRYADSTLAYQGYGHGNDLEQLRQVLAFATGGLMPDLTVLLDIDAETEGLSRRKSGGGEWNRMDDYELELHQRVRAGIPGSWPQPNPVAGW